MHELSIATSVLDSVSKVAKKNEAISVKKIDLVIGSSTAVIKESLVAAFQALKELEEYKLCANATINFDIEESTSICLNCGTEFNYGIGAAQCPNCKSYKTQIIKGSDIYIKQIEIEQDE